MRYIFLLLALPLFGKQSERYYQEKFAKEIGGQVEVVIKDGTRCDILTATHAIEVDFAKKWAEAIGQSLNYAMQTGKRLGVALIVHCPFKCEGNPNENDGTPICGKGGSFENERLLTMFHPVL